MKTLEFQTTLADDSSLKVPKGIAEQIPREEVVRVIVVLPENREEADWRQLAAEQFLAGYSDIDAIYDSL
ncbi:MAG TPA: hypothetical protein VIY49_11580 [Bryobacteraceae bacterium]